MATTLLKKISSLVFSRELFKNTYFVEQLRKAASVTRLTFCLHKRLKIQNLILWITVEMEILPYLRFQLSL